MYNDKRVRPSPFSGLRIMRSSIRNKVVLFTIIPITVAYIVIFAVHILETLKEDRINIEAFMGQQANHFAGLLNNQLHFIESIGKTMTYSLGSNPEPALLRSVIDNTLRFDNTIHAIFSGQPGQGAVYYMSKTVSDQREWDRPLEERFWTADHSGSILLNQKGWSLPFHSPIDREKLVIYQVSSVHNLYFGIKTDSFHALLNKNNPRKLRFEIVDRDSFFIYSDMRSTRPDASLRDTAVRLSSKSLLALVNGAIHYGTRGMGTVYFRDWLTLYFASPIPEPCWTLLTHTRDTFVAEARESVLYSGLLLLILLVVFGCVLKISGYITEPLFQLACAVDKLGDGNWHLDYKHQSNDEVGRLARSIFSMAQRLSERDEALKELRASNISHIAERLRGRYFYYILNNRGRLVYISPSVSDILGYAPERLMAMAGSEFIKNQAYRKFVRIIRHVLQGKIQTDAFQLALPHSSGGTRIIEMINVPVIEPDGQISGAEGMGHDVTELVNDTKKFRGLLEAAPDAIVIMASDEKISMVNARLEELSGYRRADLVGQSLGILGRNPKISLFPQRISTSDYTTTSLAFESMCRHSNGKIFPVEVTTSPLITDTGTLITIAIRDISDRKGAERELRHARDKARAADKAKSQFLSNMSHELRTPLNGILGHVQLVLRDPAVSDFQRESLETIGDCGEHLLMLINDVLDMTKMESMGVKIQFQPVRLRAMLEKVCRMLKPRADRKGLSVQLSVDESLPAVILMDVTKLRQVLINLLGNGVKFTERGGVRLKVLRDAERIVYIVIDTGIGILAQDQESVFSPFHQAQHHEHPGGTGLGLAISRRLVTAMGGGLKLASSPECGSRFYFSLPLRKSECREMPAQASSEMLRSSYSLKPGSQVCVLVVDDCRVQRENLVLLLERAGFETLDAVNGQDALDVIQFGSPALVLMAIDMPNMDGVETLLQLRQCGNLLPAIAVTDQESTVARKQLREFSGCISKPFHADVVLEEVSRVLKIKLVSWSLGQPSSKDLPNKVPAPAPAVQWDSTAISTDQRELLTELLTELMQAAAVGDIEKIKKTAEALKGMRETPGCERLPEHIEALCSDFAFDEIEKLCRSTLSMCSSTSSEAYDDSKKIKGSP